MRRLVLFLGSSLLVVTCYTVQSLFQISSPRDNVWRDQVVQEITSAWVQQITEAHRPLIRDCSDESRYYGSEPLQAYPFLKFFEGLHDPFNGFYQTNGSPLYVHIQGHSKIRGDSPVFIGFRGDTAGVHRSLLTPQVYEITRAQPTGVMLMAGSYVKYRNGTYQSVCHRRRYPEIGYIGSTWPALKGTPWEPVTRFFGEHSNLYLISYSNGSVVKDEMLQTTYQSSVSYDLTQVSNLLPTYSESSSFRYHEEVSRVAGILDIESNYSLASTWDLLKLIRENFLYNPTKVYYAATTVEGLMAYNHVLMVRALELRGVELDNGVVRYSNLLGNVVIDFVVKSRPWHRRVNLSAQAPYIRNPHVKQRLDTGHYKIVAYASKTFHSLARERGLLF